MSERLFISAKVLEDLVLGYRSRDVDKLRRARGRLPEDMRLVAVEPGVGMDGTDGFILVFKQPPAPVRPGPSLTKGAVTTE